MTGRRIMRIREVTARTGLARSTIYKMESAGAFPSRIKLTKRASGWPAEEVEAWVDDRIQESRFPSVGRDTVRS